MLAIGTIASFSLEPPNPNPVEILSTKGGAVWIPALSAIGAGFAIGLAAIGSGVGQAAVFVLL